MIDNWGLSKGRTFALLFDRPSDLQSGTPVTLVINGILSDGERVAVHWNAALNEFGISN
jgi:hypothetical protein